MIKELEYPSYIRGGFQRISWGAVIAGSIVSVAVLVFMTTLGAGIGLTSVPSAISGGGGADAAKSFGIGGGVYMLLAGIVSFFCGGWVAGRLNGIPRVSESVIHGIVSWSLTTVMLAFVLTTAVGALGSAIGISQSGAGSGTGTSIGQIAPNAQNLPGTGDVNPEDAATASRAAGIAGLFGAFMLLCNAGAAGLGARTGTRVLRPVQMTESHRRHAEV